MGIRGARVQDGQAISKMLNQLDYPSTEVFMKEKLEKLLSATNLKSIEPFIL